MNSCEDGTSKQMHTEVPSPTSVIVGQKLTSQVQKVMFFVFFFILPPLIVIVT